MISTTPSTPSAAAPTVLAVAEGPWVESQSRAAVRQGAGGWCPVWTRTRSKARAPQATAAGSVSRAIGSRRCDHHRSGVRPAASTAAPSTGSSARAGVREVTPTRGARRSRPVRCAVRRATWSWTRRAVSASGAG
ncbi:hypothetical protein ABZ439_10180 [Streptomyces sp. NPDC005840]|uniref:hypothetical protein n=1 Tax=Streptomyces sp. NPDC005840 TaxID=3157072 RepID=UPI0033D81C1B